MLCFVDVWLIGFVDDEDVGDFYDVGFDGLNFVFEFW